MTDMRTGRQYRDSTNWLPKSQVNGDDGHEYRRRKVLHATQSRALLEAIMRLHLKGMVPDMREAT